MWRYFTRYFASIETISRKAQRLQNQASDFASHEKGGNWGKQET